MHRRLKRERGKASDRACADCGSPARDWSYQYNGDPELVDHRGLKYSQDIMSCYAPRCVPCHMRLDVGFNPAAQKARSERARALGLRNGERMLADPDFAAERRELGRQVGASRAPEKVSAARTNLEKARAALSPEARQEIGRRLGGWRSEKLRTDPEYAEQQREQSRRNARKRRVCGECGMESHPPGIGRHQKISGHRGHTDV